MGGELYHGIPNVMISCNCTDTNPEEVMWYFPNDTNLPLIASKDSPYVLQQNGTLVIPRFIPLYEGKYRCEIENNSFSATSINLKILHGKQ